MHHISSQLKFTLDYATEVDKKWLKRTNIYIFRRSAEMANNEHFTAHIHICSLLVNNYETDHSTRYRPTINAICSRQLRIVFLLMIKFRCMKFCFRSLDVPWKDKYTIKVKSHHEAVILLIFFCSLQGVQVRME
jgi:hypothetical protein